LQPSVTAYASPLKLFEYMAASCLIIAPRSDNICEIVSDKNAVLFELDNYNDFAEKLAEVIESFSAFSEKRILARQVILDSEFIWQKNAMRICKLVQKNFE
jgi:glycosyltransferase involved in cell wall biosynthesis